MFSLTYRIIDAPPNIASDHTDKEDILGQVAMDFGGHRIGELEGPQPEEGTTGESLILWFSLLLKVLEQLDQFGYALQLYTGRDKGEIEYIRDGEDLLVSLVRVKNPYDYAFDVTKARNLDITYVGWRDLRIDYHIFREAILHTVLEFGHRLELVRPEAVDTPETLKLIMAAQAMLDR